MYDISKIDKNLKVETTIQEGGIRFLDVRGAPFKLYGLYGAETEPVFKRMPDAVAEATSEGVAHLAQHTAGGRVRFKTNSKYVAVNAQMQRVAHFAHMPLTGSAGFDLYLNRGGKSEYFKTFVPPADLADGYEAIIYFENSDEKDITINFPLYSGVKDLYIGLEETAFISEGGGYTYKTPVVYYGSSITQGGCASRPGNSYQAIISRMLDCEYLNLGFSGSAQGEDAVIDYIAQLDMSVFVFDYDHNAPDPEYLQATHERAYKRIRAKNPQLPIIIVSRPDFYQNDACIKRRNTVYSTYINAVNAGDAVRYIDGGSLFGGPFRDSCTVDSVHPNDLGFMLMAQKIGEAVGQMLREGGQ